MSGETNAGTQNPSRQTMTGFKISIIAADVLSMRVVAENLLQ